MQIITEIQVAASAERTWEIIGEKFADSAAWAASLESSSLTGELGVDAIRVCHTRKIGPFPAGIIKERLIEFDAKQQRYTYVVQSGMPPIFNSAQNAWSVEAINATTSVIHSHVKAELKLYLRPLDWLFTLMMKPELKKTFEELSYYIEHNAAHPRKAQLNT